MSGVSLEEQIHRAFAVPPKWTVKATVVVAACDTGPFVHFHTETFNNEQQALEWCWTQHIESSGADVRIDAKSSRLDALRNIVHCANNGNYDDDVYAVARLGMPAFQFKIQPNPTIMMLVHTPASSSPAALAMGLFDMVIVESEVSALEQISKWSSTGGNGQIDFTILEDAVVAQVAASQQQQRKRKYTSSDLGNSADETPFKKS